MTTAPADPHAPPGPAEIGIGMRISVHPHTDDFAGVILGALDDVAASGVTDGLTVETEVVSTYVGAADAPAAQRLAAYARELIAATSRRADRRHVVAHLLLSRGCPGEATCDLTTRELLIEDAIELEPTGLPAVAAWSLYPLDDSGSSHMAAIEDAIAAARRTDVTVRSAHYATILTGDLASVLAVVIDTWTHVGRTIPHVVSHVTILLDSPSPGAPGAEA